MQDIRDNGDSAEGRQVQDSRCVVIAVRYLCLMDQERSLGLVEE